MAFLPLHHLPHLERYFLSNLGFAPLENVDEVHLNLRSNWNRKGMMTDDLAAGDAVVDHSIFRRKALQITELDIFRASEHFAIVVYRVLFVPQKEVSSRRLPHNFIGIKVARLLDFV